MSQKKTDIYPLSPITMILSVSVGAPKVIVVGPVGPVVVGPVGPVVPVVVGPVGAVAVGLGIATGVHFFFLLGAGAVGATVALGVIYSR